MNKTDAAQELERIGIERNIHGMWLVPVWDGGQCHHRQVDDPIEALEILVELGGCDDAD